MKKKFLISTVLLITVLVISTSYAFATNSMLDTLGNGVQNVASGVGTMVTRGIDATKNTVEGAGNMISNGVDDARDTMTGTNVNASRTGTTGTTNNYTATRANTGDVTVAGMNATAWAWLIVGILGVAIVGLVWFYGRQHAAYSSTNNNNNND